MNLKHGVSCRKSRICFLLFLIFQTFSPVDLLVAAASPSVAAETPAATLSKTELSASGHQESILTVSKFGRYAITVKSDQGRAFSL